jgi:hypothetical protein
MSVLPLRRRANRGGLLAEGPDVQTMDLPPVVVAGPGRSPAAELEGQLIKADMPPGPGRHVHVREAERQRSADSQIALDCRGKPGGQVVGLGQRAPDRGRCVRQQAGEPQRPSVVSTAGASAA